MPRTLDRDAKAVVAAYAATDLPDETDPAYRVLAPLIAALEQLKVAVTAEREAAGVRAQRSADRRLTPEQRAAKAQRLRERAAELETI